MKLTFATLILTSTLSLAANFEDFAKAVAKVESSNNPKAYNHKEKAIGLLQIRPLYFLDAQKFDRELARFSHRDCFDPQVARRVMWAYMARYEPQALREGNYEVLARCHNAGLGWRNKRAATNGYWAKVAKNL